MPSQIFPFITPGNYTPSDTDKIEISGGKGILKLTNNPGNDFQETFDSDIEFTYDSDKAEFSGGQIQQKDKTNGANSGATYENNIDLTSWSDGVKTGVSTGGASILNGNLDLAHDDIRYVTYNADLNADGQQTGTIRMKIIPNFTGDPGTTQEIITIAKANANPDNMIKLYISNGFFGVIIYDGNTSPIYSGTVPYSFTINTEVEIEFDYDFTTGESRIFIDGIQQGNVITATGIRSNEIELLRIGGGLAGASTTNFKVNGFMIYNTVQHTSNYTLDVIPDYIYLGSSVILPEMEYTGAGTLIAVTNFVTSFGGSPRLALQIGQSGDWLYWDGAQWTDNDDTYAQANDPATFAANVATLPVTGEIYGQFKIYFTDTNTQGTFEDLVITLTAQIYSIDNSYLDINSRWYMDKLEAISAVKTVTGSDEVKLALKKGTQFYYILGGVLTESDGTYSQSTTVEDWETYKALFTSVKTYIGVRIFLHSNDGTTTPSIDTLTIQYSYAGETPDTINTCLVWYDGYKDGGDVNLRPIKIYSINSHIKYKNVTKIFKEERTVYPDSTGYWEIELVENENMEGNQGYVFEWDKNDKSYLIVPDQETANINDLEEWEANE